MNSEEQAIVHNLLVPQEGGVSGELLGQLLRGRRVDLQAEVEVVVLQLDIRHAWPAVSGWIWHGYSSQTVAAFASSLLVLVQWVPDPELQKPPCTNSQSKRYLSE